jgi:hypothetical protein
MQQRLSHVASDFADLICFRYLILFFCAAETDAHLPLHRLAQTNQILQILMLLLLKNFLRSTMMGISCQGVHRKACLNMAQVIQSASWVSRRATQKLDLRDSLLLTSTLHRAHFQYQVSSHTLQRHHFPNHQIFKKIAPIAAALAVQWNTLP